MNPAKLAAFAIGCAAIVWLVMEAGAGAIGSGIAALGWGGLGIVTALHAPVLAAMGVAWWFIGRDALGATPRKFVAARFVRDAVAENLPFSQLGGFALGVRALRLAGVGTLPGGASMFADLVTEFAAKVPYVLAGIAVLTILAPESHLAGPLVLALMLVALVAIVTIAMQDRFTALVGRLLSAAARRWTPLKSLQEFREEVRELARQKPRLVAAFAVHAACWFFGALETWVVFDLMGAPITPAEALVIDSLVSALRTFGFLVPAAAGVQEGSYVLICGMFGLPASEALAFSVIRRARELLLGVPGLVAWQVLETKSARPSGEA